MDLCASLSGYEDTLVAVGRRIRRSNPLAKVLERCSQEPSTSRGPASASSSTVVRKASSPGIVFASLPAGEILMKQSDNSVVLSDTMRHITAGTAARTLAQVFIHPIDTVKTRLQVCTPAERLVKWRKKISLNCFEIQFMHRRILRTRNWLVRGPMDVYLGLSGAVLGTIPTALVYFWVYEESKERLQGSLRGDAAAALTHILSASAGAITSSLVRVPTDTVRHRVQAYLYPDVFQATAKILQRNGPAGLYAGLVPTILRDVPEIAIQFGIYETARRVQEQRSGKAQLETWQHLLLGGFAGACASAATMPLDTAKTMIQCGMALPVHRAMHATMQDKGVAGLFAGMGPRVTQTAVMSAVFFTLFEFWKAQLKPQRMRPPEDALLLPKLYSKRREHVWKRQFTFR